MRPAQQPAGFDWALWFQWIVATTFGWLIGSFIFPGLGFAAAGITVGALQALVLYRRIPAAWRWALASAAGWLAGWLVGLAFIPEAQVFIAASLLGAALGTAQWLVLRRQARWSGWWIAISVVGWSSGIALLPGLFSSGVLPGAITGIALVLLLRPNQKI
jgi:hypothetical protein